MNAANLCPAPRSVASAVTDLTRSINVDCSFQNRARFDRDREAARELVAGQLGVTADEIALVRNTSEANNIVNNGLDLGPDEEVVTWDQNHPTNNVAWAVRARRRGFAVRSVTVPADPVGPEGPDRAVSPRSHTEDSCSGTDPRLQRQRHSAAGT